MFHDIEIGIKKITTNTFELHDTKTVEESNVKTKKFIICYIKSHCAKLVMYSCFIQAICYSASKTVVCRLVLFIRTSDNKHRTGYWQCCH